MSHKTHKDVKFTALTTGGRTKNFRTFEDALIFATHQSLENGTWTNVNVFIHSESGAKWWGGKAAVELFRSQSELPMYQQFITKLEDQGVF